MLSPNFAPQNPYFKYPYFTDVCLSVKPIHNQRPGCPDDKVLAYNIYLDFSKKYARIRHVVGCAGY